MKFHLCRFSPKLHVGFSFRDMWNFKTYSKIVLKWKFVEHVTFLEGEDSYKIHQWIRSWEYPFPRTNFCGRFHDSILISWSSTYFMKFFLWIACELDLSCWKSKGFILCLRTTSVGLPSCSHFYIQPTVTLTFDQWTWKSKGFGLSVWPKILEVSVIPHMNTSTLYVLSIDKFLFYHIHEVFMELYIVTLTFDHENQ